MRASRERCWIALIALASLGCSSPRQAIDVPSFAPDDEWRLEETCERELLRLHALIEKRTGQRSFSRSVIIEAEELLELSEELYLEREYALALRFIEDGIRLLE